MTAQRADNGGTQFSKWLRVQKELDSKDGFVTSDLDFIWMNYKTEEFLLLEEKRQMQEVGFAQREILKTIHKSCRKAKGYNGLHFIQFENQDPEDSKAIYLNHIQITKEQLIKFLRFELKWNKTKKILE